MTALAVEAARRVFPGGRRRAPVVALEDVSIAVEEASILVVLGPSGSGKSTLLRAVAGLERLDAGRVTLRGRDVTDDPPGRRDVGMVFQDQALLPHLSVLENIAFGEVARGTPRAEARARAAEAAETVGVSGLLARWPGQLSGGEAQRVALARALVRRPAAFLLDEPLSALDPVLRVRLREELRDLQRDTGTAVLHVTHDQQEALSLADRIAVLRDGRVVQVGTPEELHRAPVDVFVAEFVAALPLNLLVGAAVGGAAPTVGIRPERCRLAEPGSGRIDGRVTDVAALGEERLVRVETAAGRVHARVDPPGPALGAAVAVDWPPSAELRFGVDGGLLR